MWDKLHFHISIINVEQSPTFTTRPLTCGLLIRPTCVHNFNQMGTVANQDQATYYDIMLNFI